MTARAPALRALYVEVLIRAPMERVWQLTQDPRAHVRWDARFSSIRPTSVRSDGAQIFTYERSMLVHTIRGRGVSLGEKHGSDGGRTSALLFHTDDRLSPLRSGRGYWRYVPHREGVRFITGYDYAPWSGSIGRLIDRLLVRRVVWWLTAWSFDRLRLWAEEGIEPERTGWWRGWFGRARGRASNCLSRPPGRPEADAMSEAPSSLDRIERSA